MRTESRSIVASRWTTLLGASALVAASSVAMAGDVPAESSRHEVVKVHEIVVRKDAAPSGQATPRTIVLESRATNGEKLATEVRVISGSPDDVLTFQLDDLGEGQTRTFQTPAGKDIEVKRDGDRLLVTVDGETTEAPAPPMGSGVFGIVAAGDRQMLWTEGADGAEPEAKHRAMKVFVHRDAGDAHPMVLALHRKVNFNELEALAGLDPEVRAKVVAALEEILASPEVLSLEMDDTKETPGIE